MLKNIVIALLTLGLISGFLVFQKKLYRASVEIAEARCGEMVNAMPDRANRTASGTCKLVHHDIFMKLEIENRPDIVMSCGLDYGFWGPSRPSDCEIQKTRAN